MTPDQWAEFGQYCLETDIAGASRKQMPGVCAAVAYQLSHLAEQLAGDDRLAVKAAAEYLEHCRKVLEDEAPCLD